MSAISTNNGITVMPEIRNLVEEAENFTGRSLYLVNLGRTLCELPACSLLTERGDAAFRESLPASDRAVGQMAQIAYDLACTQFFRDKSMRVEGDSPETIASLISQGHTVICYTSSYHEKGSSLPYILNRLKLRFSQVDSGDSRLWKLRGGILFTRTHPIADVLPSLLERFDENDYQQVVVVDDDYRELVRASHLLTAIPLSLRHFNREAEPDEAISRDILDYQIDMVKTKGLLLSDEDALFLLQMGKTRKTKSCQIQFCLAMLLTATLGAVILLTAFPTDWNERNGLCFS